MFVKSIKAYFDDRFRVFGNKCIGLDERVNQQNDLIKKQNKRLRKIQNSVESLHTQLKTISALLDPDNSPNGAFDAAQKLQQLQTQMDASLAGTIVEQPGTD